MAKASSPGMWGSLDIHDCYDVTEAEEEKFKEKYWQLFDQFANSLAECALAGDAVSIALFRAASDEIIKRANHKCRQVLESEVVLYEATKN